MKKYFLAATGLALTISLVFVACKKKTDDNAITPTFKEDANGTGGNPTKNEVTVTGTGTNNITNPASANSSIQTGGSGWSNPSCITTSSLSIKANNGSVDVTVNFAAPPSAGQTYQVGSSVGAGYCTVVVNNAPSQPAGVVWYGKTGSVSVTTATSGISAQLNNVQCVQQTFNFPQVTVNGNIGCN
jgi:hypothetical protein